MRVAARPALIAAAMGLLLLVQMAGPALHAVAFYAHDADAAHHHHDGPNDHDAGDCEVCQFVAGLTPVLPRPACQVTVSPAPTPLIAHRVDVPRSAHLRSSSARAPPAWS